MPYIIETRKPIRNFATGETQPNIVGGLVSRESRRAVATLEEARTAAYRAAIAANPPMVEQPEYAGLPLSDHEAIDALPAEGGTVGPLPDGTVIEVGAVAWPTLIAGIPAEHVPGPANRSTATLVAAYNTFNTRENA